MVVVSLVIQGGQYVYEENIVMKHQVPPMRMVGIEGMFGLVFIFNWMMVFSFVKCPSASMCDIDGYFEDPITGLIQMFSDWRLLSWCIGTVFSIMFFNLYGLTLTQNVSSVFRAFWNAARTITVWVN